MNILEGDANPIITEDDMEIFAVEVSQYISRDDILSLDVFSISKYNKQQIISFNYSRPDYLYDILPGFLSDVGSIGFVNESLEIYKDLGEQNKYIKNEPLVYQHTPVQEDKHKTVEFEEYINYLNRRKFGVSCLWINDSTKHDDVETNISVLIVLNISLNDHQKSELVKIAYKKLFTKGYRITTHGFRDLYLGAERDKFAAEESAKILYHYGHTIQNLFPQGLSMVRDVLGKLDKNALYYKQLVSAEKALTVSKMLFQSIIKQPIKEFEDKSVIDIMHYLAGTYDSRHPVEFTITDHRFDNIVASADDTGDIFLVLWNFLHNAAKYSGCGTEEDIRTVQMTALEYEGSLAIKFVNTGTLLIKPGTRDFMQGNSQITDPEDWKDGRGGLVIARKKAEKLGWKIEIPEYKVPIPEVVMMGNKEIGTYEYYTTVIFLTTNIKADECNSH